MRPKPVERFPNRSKFSVQIVKELRPHLRQRLDNDQDAEQASLLHSDQEVHVY